MSVNMNLTKPTEEMRVPLEEKYPPLPRKVRIKKGDMFLLNTDIKVENDKKGTSSFSKGTMVTATGNLFGNKKHRLIEVTIGRKMIRTKVSRESLSEIIPQPAALMN